VAIATRLLSGALALTLAGSAGATEAIEEVAHEIEVELGTQRATLVVRRTVGTSFVDEHEAHFIVQTSEPMVGVGLRTRGDDGRWYRAELLPIERAIDTYWSLTGSLKVAPDRAGVSRMSSMSPKDPALMMWSREGFDVYVFPVVKARPKAIEYTLAAPYSYEGGAYRLAVPVGGENELAPQIRIAAVPRGYRAFVGDVEVQAGSVVSGTTIGEQWVRLVPPSRPELTVRVASTPAGERHLARVEVEVGPLLGPDPKDTHVVIALDRSRSMTDSGADAARRAALDYLGQLEQVPGARAAIVMFDRAVVPLHAGFLAPAEAAALLRAAPTDRANGSDLPGALAVATKLLAQVGGAAPRRVLVLSDTAIDPAAEEAARRLIAGSRAVVHVADLEDGEVTSLGVDDRHRWDDVVGATGGVVWRGEVKLSAAEPDPAFAEWIRPRRVSDLVVTRDGLPLMDGWDLRRGEGSQDVAVLELAPRGVRATGRVWGRRIAVEARRTAADDRAWSVLAAAHVGDELTDAEVGDVARRAGAVSPRTALLALEPGARPGQAAPADPPERTGRSFSCGMRVGGGGNFGRHSLWFDEAAFIREAVATAAKACRVRHLDVTAALTTSFAEVVAVGRVEVPGEPQAESCVREKLWEIDFPPGRAVAALHVVELEGSS
jgi:hypothetical protein